MVTSSRCVTRLAGIQLKQQPPEKISEQLRELIGKAAVSRYRIGIESGVDEAAIGRFFHGTHGLRLDSVDRLGLYLKVRLVIDDEEGKTKG